MARIQSKHFGYLIAGIGLFLLLYQFVFFAQEGQRLIAWIPSGNLNLSITGPEELGPWTLREVGKIDLVDGLAPEVGDSLLAIQTANGDSLLLAELRSMAVPAGEVMHFTLKRGEDSWRCSLAHVPHETQSVVAMIALEIVRFLITIGFLAVGLWALSKRPELAGVRALALFSISMPALMLAGVSLGFERLPAFTIPGQAIIDAGLGLLISGISVFWLNLQLYFPKPLKWIQRRTLAKHLLIYLPQILILAITIVDETALENWLFTVVMSSQFFLGFILLHVRRRRSQEAMERRQLSLVSWGSGIGLGMLFTLVILSALPELAAKLPPMTFLWMILLTFLGLLVSPISFAFAFGRYRLLEVEGRLHRGTRYLLVTGVLLVVFFTALYFASDLLLGSFNLSGRSPTLAVALVLALGFTPLHRRAQGVFEGRIYPERKRLRALLDNFHAGAGSMADRGSLFASLEQSLREGMGITTLVPAMWDPSNQCYQLPGEEILPFEMRGQLTRTLHAKREPILMDELIAAGRIVLSDPELAWLEARRVGVILPLSLRGEPMGLLFLVCGVNWEGMSVAGLEELRNLGSQVALECENLSLLEQTLDKRRLEEQLAMARKVQEGFLPSSLPDTPGLDLAATYQSSLEVAGDYYDVLALPEGRTLMTVGDVSGKGAGAAMIMANLQASLRSMARVGVPLGEMVGGINDLIHANTPVEQFITFFVAVYDPGTGLLTFVNAGHNPPRIIGEGGAVSELDPVGPILGVFPGLEFGEQSVTVKPGDLLVAFTDGVSEAMNAADEDFGEDRISDAVIPNMTDSPERLLEVIRNAVDDFRGEVELMDDYTLLVARVLKA